MFLADISDNLMTQGDAASALVTHIFGGAIGCPDGKGVGYALIEATPEAFTWSACLESWDDNPTSLDRYMLRIDRRSRAIGTPVPIVIPEAELRDAILSATGHHLATSSRLTDGALSISYKVTV